MGQEPKYSDLIQSILKERAKFKRVKTTQNIKKRLLKVLGRSERHLVYLFAYYNPYTSRLLIKDPHASFASEYLHQEFQMEAVILIRHPAAFVASVKRLQWTFNLDMLRRQKALQEQYLSHVLSDEVINNTNLVENAAYVWLCINHVLSIYLDRNPNMILVHHEDISQNPTEQLRRLYDQLQIEYTDHINQTICKYTSDNNPSAPEGNKIHVLKRNSKANIDGWKDLLSPEEIARVRDITSSAASCYYSDDEW
jgi:hypothetical protein